jgi:hypothetical protein
MSANVTREKMLKNSKINVLVRSHFLKWISFLIGVKTKHNLQINGCSYEEQSEQSEHFEQHIL